MPWDMIKLNDGTEIPSIAFGTWKLGNGETTVVRVNQALEVGFTHIDSAQVYRNEKEAGEALRARGLRRQDAYITTKYSGRADIETSVRESCGYLGVDYIDLYLIHGPDLAVPDIATIWAKMEKIQEAGFAKSIGVSNFNVPELQTLLASARIKPVVNQILFHPYVLSRQAPIVAFGARHGIVSEAYSVLIPITRYTGGPLDAPLKGICQRLGAEPEQVLLAWAKAKGVVVVTSSTKKERLQGYLKAGDLELTTADVEAIDAAGLAGSRR
ncbi:Aldo/keto reductase [Daedalea quercina L-15889]|uniref:Aldo/keto reductase n=1 Tax=Daedalea quercina L-15889 TaxID=1314783 RepID=A0A165KUD8_9APHY|nr:Aldo/keto reductase [Daedalea quercina L-15889]